MNHSHAKPIAAITITTKAAYSVIGTALKLMFTDQDCASVSRSDLDPHQTRFPELGWLATMPNLIPSLSAFCRSEPTDLFMTLPICATDVRAFE